MRKQLQQGFTLLEVMVVLAIIGGLLAMATLSSGDRQAQDETTQFAHHLSNLFSAYRQEAVFQNIDLGVAMDEQALQLLSFQDINSQEFSANKTREELDKLSKNPWQAYSGSLKSQLEAPEHVFIALNVEGQEVDFDSLLDEEDGAKPALMFLSSDEYTPYLLTLTHDSDDHFQVLIRGDGFGAPLIKVETYEN